MSQPDDCERNPAAARAVIVDGTRHVAAAARAAGARLVHLSTDLVFEGTRGSYRETDPVGGCSVYARAKIEAEAVAAAEAADVVILRLALLYGPGTRRYPGFVDTVLGRWAAGEAMTFYVDQFRTPAPTRHVAEAVRRILARPHVRGLLHLGGADRVSRYEFARLLAEVAGAPPELVRAGTMREASGPAPRGADCSLDSRRAEERLGLRPVGCRAGLAELAASGGLIH
jgi:dTDP-4-dehydrorhamnose reductase